jgi:ATP-dependent Clp protease ATP-binding subunit ClpC
MSDVTTVYDRFTALAKRVLVAAGDAAASLGHDFIGTEHLLLGLAQTAGTASETLRAHGVELGRVRAEMVRQLATSAETQGAATAPKPTAQDALSSLGIDVAEIRRRADETFGAGALKYPRPAYSLRAKKVVQSALKQARELGQERIDTEHLLLGMLENGGTGVQVLTALGVAPEALRQSVLERIA